MGYNLLKDGVYWGYNPLTNHLLTFWDILVGSKPDFTVLRLAQDPVSIMRKLYTYYSLAENKNRPGFVALANQGGIFRSSDLGLNSMWSQWEFQRKSTCDPTRKSPVLGACHHRKKTQNININPNIMISKITIWCWRFVSSNILHPKKVERFHPWWKGLGTWRIIPSSKWLIAMVSQFPM